VNYDATHHILLAFGGGQGSTLWNAVQQYNPATGAWCLSSVPSGAPSGAVDCSPPVTGTPPSEATTCTAAPGCLTAEFSIWTFNTTTATALLYVGTSAGVGTTIYTYDPGANAWTSSPTPNGNCYISGVWTVSSSSCNPATQVSGDTYFPEWVYDSVDDVYIFRIRGWTEGFQTWQLPANSASQLTQ
jgi:hypothetical protein